ncbi:unnamed protein product [Citrullus colocynthis]|uniref:Calmodulin binding protein-like N-terminal domain-containing protein n=1 Tax=Citrullus colocynthis TaxID=252529 RepID=A0ABP0Z6S1_9ROSI
MDPSSASTGNENKKKGGSSEEAEDVQDDSKRSCLISIPLPTGDEAGFRSIDKDSNNNVELNDHFLTESWPKIEPLFRDLAYQYLEKKLRLEVHSFLLSLSNPVAADEKKKKRVISSDEAPEVRENSKRICRESLPFLTCKQHENSGSSSRTLQFKLVFRNQIATRMYANDEIKSESGDPLEIALCDLNGDAVSSSKQWPSAPLKFFLLDGNLKEITNSRERKPSSLISDDYPNNCLQNGFCFVSNVKVTDNSSWMINKKLRLGVKIVDENFLEDYGMIEPAISRDFQVLDDRGKEKKWNKIYNHAMECYTRNDPTIDLQVNNVDLVENQTANDELIGNEGQGNLNNDPLVEVYQQNNTLQANNDQVEANCNENSEVCEQMTNGDNQLQTTVVFDEFLNFNATGEIEALAPYDPFDHNPTLSPTWIV